MFRHVCNTRVPHVPLPRVSCAISHDSNSFLHLAAECSPSGREFWSTFHLWLLLFYSSSSVSVRRTCTGCRWLSCAPCWEAPARSQSPGSTVGAAVGWGGGAGFCGPPTRSGAGGREGGGLEMKRACDARIMLTTGPWRGWSEGMNLDYSEPDSALSSSERRAPILESRQPNSDLERCNRENTSLTQQ